MPASGARPRKLSDADLDRVLVLLKDADSVELKLTVPDTDVRSAVTALGMDPLDAQIRQAYFFDTPDLTCNQHGVVVRARRIQRRGDDTVVKLRPVVPSELPAGLRASKNFSVEVDAMPDGYVCSASLKDTPKAVEVKAVATGDQPIRKLFSKEQRNFFAAYAPNGLELDDLSVLGPINLLKLKFSPWEFGRRLVAELWLYPNGSRILELSTKCAPAEAFEVAVESRVFLAKQGVDLSGEQQTKTATALKFFSRNLEAKTGA
jgi:hypothetical protein